jgi:amidophosphoribosyltransferase
LSSTRNEHHTYPPSSYEDRVDDIEIDSGPARGMRRVRRLGTRRGRRQADLLRALRAAAPRQEAAGIAVSDGRRTVVFKDLGLVSQVFDEQVLSSLRGTSPSATSATPRPAPPPGRTPSRRSAPRGRQRHRAGHNGNLVNTAELRDEVARCARRRDGRGVRPAPTRTWSASCSPDRRGHRVEEAAMRLLPRLRGAFSLVFATSRPSTPRATRTASGRWCSAGWSAAGSSPARPPRWTSSARRWSARSSPAS